ncbi:glycerol-3-phosphate dehydrogenase [Trypanosoma theileri]|uniref:Glycerol-3-phosphate dehydrogenase [NAD(+)] n=1 Tax=Trypanosoma theileri TaxID=67003 RepID=A0A1X0NQ93_9TRYP|nr:glycerol-3-phosphate dehydrogenase [Trypanosoma theileri]ORC86857.1 glycerol-3-phosphate dehydrogenase [Trypanosoma theileri]
MISNIKYVNHAAVLGSGAFGTALACVLAKKAKTVSAWHINAKEAETMDNEGENKFFLKGVKLPKNLFHTANTETCVKEADILLVTIPTQFIRSFFKKNRDVIQKHIIERNIPIVVCSKGIEKSTLRFPTEILQEFFPQYPFTVLAGPSFAIEVAKGILTHVCTANADIKKAQEVQRILTTPDGSFRCWSTTDTIGCEVASAVKNVLAIASGMYKGLGNELNARAALITRGLLEIRDLSLALGGTGEAVFGLAGLGDLLLTCSSELSRNFTVGLKLGQGISLEEIQRTSKAVAEGVATAEPLERLAAKCNVHLPIAQVVYKVLYEKKNVREAFEKLNTCPLSDEGLPPLVRTSKL